MSAKIIDGKAVAAGIENSVRQEVEALRTRNISPRLVVIRPGNDPASEVYVRNKERKAKEVGIDGEQIHLPDTVTQDELASLIDRLNRDESVDGILLQLPLPAHLDARPLLDAIDPMKDVDGFHPVNAGRLQQGRHALVPCTPLGVIELIRSTGTPMRGRRAVIVGRSDIVGKPLAALLLQNDATVTICHSRTEGLEEIASQADILVAAVGRPLLVGADAVKPGSVVIDVGINRVVESDENAALLRHDALKSALLHQKGSVLVGDVDFARAQQRAGWITPVPGGVGPMTIAMLLANTVRAAKARRA